MAIRPTDLQSALIVSQAQAPPVATARAEQARGPRLELRLPRRRSSPKSRRAQRARCRNHTDAPSSRIEVDGREQPDQQGRGRKRERKPGDPFDEVVEDAAGLSDGTAHLIDYSA